MARATRKRKSAKQVKAAKALVPLTLQPGETAHAGRRITVKVPRRDLRFLERRKAAQGET